MKKLCLLLSGAFALMILAACDRTPTAHNESQDPKPTTVSVPDSNKASVDSVLKFLLDSAAYDFHTHGPAKPKDFREVRFGHRLTSDGQKQYFISGEFLASADKKPDTWTLFTTVKTSGYEQWIGSQGKAFSQDSSVVWEGRGDLSSALQRQMDVLR